MDSSDRVTALLAAVREGKQEALDEVFGIVYDQLHHAASVQRQRWQGNETLNTTVLVHEAYLKLVDQGNASWNDRGHFLAVASRAMRHILVNYAKRQSRVKRGGDRRRVTLAEVGPVDEDAADELLALDAALERLGEVNERQARVVEARFFSGLSIEDTANAVGVSPATVKRDWALASAWLQRQVESRLA